LNNLRTAPLREKIRVPEPHNDHPKLKKSLQKTTTPHEKIPSSAQKKKDKKPYFEEKQ